MQRKHIVFAFFVCFIFLLFSSCGKPKNTPTPGKNLIIWTYDSFTSEWGPGPEISRVFAEKTGVKITWESRGDSGQVLSRLLSEGEKADADIILGIDQNMADRALESGLLEAYRPIGAEGLFPELVLDAEFRLTPLDYSYFAIVYDSEKFDEKSDTDKNPSTLTPPKSLEDLCNPTFAQSLILIDPRTSSVGLGFFAWVKEVYGPLWKDYWLRLKPSILTITEGWSSAYGLFTRGEAPMVLSYTTSPGYHLEYENTERFRAAIFSDGHVLQIEAAGLLKAAPNRENAQTFLDFMLGKDFQEIIPLTNWMYPVIDIPLPPSFSINPKSGKPLRPGPVTEADLNEWAAIMSGR